MAAAVKQLQDEMPQFITFGMSHYYSEPKRVRFQSEGGKFIDADAIATAFAETTVLQDECKIHHLMGDIEDNREHRDPTTTPAVPIDELVQITQEKLADTTDEADRRAWLFALFDQLDDIDEATKHNLEPLVVPDVLRKCGRPVVGRGLSALTAWCHRAGTCPGSGAWTIGWR